MNGKRTPLRFRTFAHITLAASLIPFTTEPSRAKAQAASTPPAAPVSTPQMTNADVVELVGLGLSADVVIDKIHAAKATSFDTSVAGLKELKAASVPDAVIRVMINPQATDTTGTNTGPMQPPAMPPAQEPPQPPGPVVYFHSTDGKSRIYVTDHAINEFVSVGRASRSSSASVAHAQFGDDPRTVEIQADVQRVCPAYVLVSNNPDRADYILVFRRQGGKRTSAFAFGGLTGLAIAAGAKVDGSSLFQLNGDMIYATKENSVEKAIKATCAHIPPPAPAVAAPSAP